MGTSGSGTAESHAVPAAIAIVHTTDRSGVRVDHAEMRLAAYSLDETLMRAAYCIAQTT
jgi:hypothetical protein